MNMLTCRRTLEPPHIMPSCCQILADLLPNRSCDIRISCAIKHCCCRFNWLLVTDNCQLRLLPYFMNSGSTRDSLTVMSFLPQYSFLFYLMHHLLHGRSGKRVFVCDSFTTRYSRHKNFSCNYFWSVIWCSVWSSLLLWSFFAVHPFLSISAPATCYKLQLQKVPGI